MSELKYPSSFDYDALLASGRGELFGPGNAQLPAPPMLMFDRITQINADGGAHGKGFVWNAADLTRIREFPLAGEGWGVTDDGARLIVSDGTPWLRFLDPETQAETGRVQVTFRGRPLPQLNELEWIDGEVWANVWRQDAIVRINPATGVVTGVVDLNGLLPDRTGLDPADDVLNGIAWDPQGRRLFVTGKHWPSLFEIRVVAPPALNLSPRTPRS